MNRLKSLIRDVSKCLFLHFLGFSFFATPNSLGSKNLLRKHCYLNMSFCDPHFGGTPRSAISIKLPLCYNSSSSPIQNSILSTGTQTEASYLYMGTPSKNLAFVPRVTILIFPIFRKVLSILIYLDI